MDGVTRERSAIEALVFAECRQMVRTSRGRSRDLHVEMALAEKWGGSAIPESCDRHPSHGYPSISPRENEGGGLQTEGLKPGNRHRRLDGRLPEP